MDWLDLLAGQGTLKSLLQHHSSRALILWCSAFFLVQLSHPYMTTGKTIASTRRTFVGKVVSLLFNMLSAAAKSLQSCPTLCDPIDSSPPGSSIHGILQQEYWSRLPFPSPGDLPDTGIEPGSSALQADSLLSEIPGKSYLFYAAAKSLQLCLTLCDPIDSSPPGSAVPGILKARTLEWVAISFSSA